jgi:hypothetical protein
MTRSAKGTEAPILLEPPVPLTRVEPKGIVKVAFWALRIYIAIMLVLVAIGFRRGLH